MVDYEYFKQALVHTKKPCAFLHLEALQKNINNIVTIASDVKVRVASKSIRSVEVLRTILSSSSIFQGVMCFTTEEALFLYEKGFDDLLVAYPTWNEKQLKKICDKVKSGATITLMIDSIEHIQHLENIALEENGHFLVCMDIDLSTKMYGLHFGVHRSPIKTLEDVIHIIERIKRSSCLILDGLMGYEAQIAGVIDAAPRQMIKNNIVRFLKKRSSQQILIKRKQIKEYLDKEGISIRFINGGGTGSLQQTTKDPYVTEVTVGSGFFNPHLFDKYKDFQLEVAAGFAVEITRIPKKNIYTCFGGGYVASGAAGKDKLPEIFLPKGATLTVNEGVGEVQTPVMYKGSIHLKHGDPIFFRHSKAGELCERFHYLHVIQNGKVVNKFSTYRGDGKCFL